MYTLVNSDVIEWARGYSGQRFHAVLCDPPYELGFMGKAFDKTGISFRSETWRVLGEHLYPGAFGIAFASSRGWHRLAVAIEDAGFIIHPSIFGWATGQGFPKATRIDTKIDEKAGKLDERKVIGSRLGQPGYSMTDAINQGTTLGWSQSIRSGEKECAIVEPATDLAKTWAGHRYGLQALSPSLEPIIVFQKPYEGRPLDCITETGAGALWIEGCRIETTDNLNGGAYSGGDRKSSAMGLTGEAGGKSSILEAGTKRLNPDDFVQPLGRWPKNLILLDDGAAEALDRQSKITKSSGGRSGHTAAYCGGYKQEYYGDEKPGYGDVGGASRFFFRVQEQIDEADPVRYVAKASKRERDAGCEGMEEKAVQEYGSIRENRGSGYDKESIARNHHPTVKPIALTEYLARLILPPAEYAPRRILVPFAGSGSEMIGAHRAGWDEITGIEMDAEYCQIAEARLKYWTSKPRQLELK